MGMEVWQTMTYRVIDGQTGRQVGTDYATSRRAGRCADRLNQEYGAHRYSVLWVTLAPLAPLAGKVGL
jgi:hypothetical protein